ncbi:MAG: hypothetical protein HYX78_13230 [Armatimonadetes bacterium]|nr:hypothetical protein [Armatimonadota bacterium]
MSLPYYGGMRHIHVTPGSFDQACGEIRNLSDAEVQKVLEFIGRLKAERRPSDETAGTADALLRHAGRFSFNEGERERLLSAVIEMREVAER